MIKHFSDLSIPATLLANIPFQTMTDVQAQAIPYALRGTDVIATSQTGSGKTLAYGVPLISKLMSNPATSALILTPTRELAIQVMGELQQLIPSRTIPTALLIGGQKPLSQCQQLNHGARLVVGTPGRINDHLSHRNLRLNTTQLFVLDEVDRMLDMGFAPQVDAIIRCLPFLHQTLMFSATLSTEVENIARRLLRNPARVYAGPSNKAPPQIEQQVIQVSSWWNKMPPLVRTLHDASGSILVFANTQRATEIVVEAVRRQGHWAQYLHGGLTQAQRNHAMSEFRDEKAPILVATDVAARGLDVLHVRCVINFDLPRDPEDYLHRIGRTARAGAAGLAISIVAPQETLQLNAICRFMKMAPPPPFRPGAVLTIQQAQRATT